MLLCTGPKEMEQNNSHHFLHQTDQLHKSSAKFCHLFIHFCDMLLINFSQRLKRMSSVLLQKDRRILASLRQDRRGGGGWFRQHAPVIAGLPRVSGASMMHLFLSHLPSFMPSVYVQIQRIKAGLGWMLIPTCNPGTASADELATLWIAEAHEEGKEWERQQAYFEACTGSWQSRACQLNQLTEFQTVLFERRQELSCIKEPWIWLLFHLHFLQKCIQIPNTCLGRDSVTIMQVFLDN